MVEFVMVISALHHPCLTDVLLPQADVLLPQADVLANKTMCSICKSTVKSTHDPENLSRLLSHHGAKNEVKLSN